VGSPTRVPSARAESARLLRPSGLMRATGLWLRRNGVLGKTANGVAGFAEPLAVQTRRPTHLGVPMLVLGVTRRGDGERRPDSRRPRHTRRVATAA
jgi:hypothetical protein